MELALFKSHPLSGIDITVQVTGSIMVSVTRKELTFASETCLANSSSSEAPTNPFLDKARILLTSLMLSGGHMVNIRFGSLYRARVQPLEKKKHYLFTKFCHPYVPTSLPGHQSAQACAA